VESRFSAVASSFHRQLFGFLGLALLAGCSVGVGEGQASGELNAPACGLSGPFDLAPTFFVADPIESQMVIRIQTSGDFDFLSDGITINISDVPALAERLGEPIELTGEHVALVTFNLYANASCPLNRDDVPVNYLGVGGTVTFFSIYSVELNPDELLISARFDDVVFVDPASPEERNARMSGDFDFLFNRGRPAQRFP
jgi:hypothetical protein